MKIRNNLFIIVFLASCTSTEIGNSKDIEPNAIAQQIDVVYNEEEGLDAKIRFRVSGANGTTLVLNNPASVTLDGGKLKVDSTGNLGAYYSKDLGFSSGKHSFLYTDKNGKAYENSFAFNGFGLANRIPSTINKENDLELEFKGLNSGATVNFDIKDTSFGNSVYGNQTLVGNKLIITKEKLAKLNKGPLTIELSHNETKNLQETTPEGGEIRYLYQLRKIKTKLQ